MAKSPSASGSYQPASNNAGCGVLLLVLIGTLALCSRNEPGEPGSLQPLEANLSSTDPTSTGIPAEADASPSAVRQAGADAARAIGALGASGARLYSENCYAFLRTSHAQGTLDRCLAFDLLSARVTAGLGDYSEAGWFDETAVRSRFLDSRSLVGESIDEAERRFASVTAMASRLAVDPVAPPEPQPASSDESQAFASDDPAASHSDTQGNAGASEGGGEEEPSLSPVDEGASAEPLATSWD